jgi:hypothetical protein
LDMARRIEEGESLVGPGIPPGYAKGKELVSEDYFQPRKMALFGE